MARVSSGPIEIQLSDFGGLTSDEAVSINIAAQAVVDLATKQVDSPSKALINQLQSTTGIINIRVADSAEVRRLNLEHAGHDYETDVLTFSYLEESDMPAATEAPTEIADIIIARGVAEEQAKAAGTDLRTELALLAAHGTLHALGYDHDTDDGRARMDELQRQALASAGMMYREFNWQS